jgi:hypothetical protein
MKSGDEAISWKILKHGKNDISQPYGIEFKDCHALIRRARNDGESNVDYCWELN